MKWQYLIPLSIAIIGIFIVVVVGFQGEESATPTDDRAVQQTSNVSQEGQGTLSDLGAIPAFSFESFDGKTMDSDDIVGKVAVINSWATWCPFCVDELPDFAELQEEFGDRVIVIAIDRAEPKERAKDFTDDLGVTGRMTLLLDPRDSFYQAIGGFSMPETLFVDTQGRIRIHKRGPMPLEEMREKIESVLALSETQTKD